jgi:hypothetical protein
MMISYGNIHQVQIYIYRQQLQGIDSIDILILILILTLIRTLNLPQFHIFEISALQHRLHQASSINLDLFMVVHIGKLVLYRHQLLAL